MVPESPRWLMIKNRMGQAYFIFKKIAKANKKQQLSELETLRPDECQKKFNLNTIKPCDEVPDANRMECIVNDENEQIKTVTLQIISRIFQ